MEQIDWDMATVTAGDYTVEFVIDQSSYENWKNIEYKRPGGAYEHGDSPAHALKLHMIQIIEPTLDQWVASNYTNVCGIQETKKKNKKDKKEKASTEDTQGIKTRIADITFSFNNRDLIIALRARGAKIANNDFEGMRKQDKKLQELLKEVESLTTPTSAFITFESDDSKSYALHQDGTGATKLLGQPFKFKEASEPTDIIWENR